MTFHDHNNVPCMDSHRWFERASIGELHTGRQAARYIGAPFGNAVYNAAAHFRQYHAEEQGVSLVASRHGGFAFTTDPDLIAQHMAGVRQSEATRTWRHWRNVKAGVSGQLRGFIEEHERSLAYDLGTGALLEKLLRDGGTA